MIDPMLPKLSLTLIAGPGDTPPETRSVSGYEFAIGRGQKVDWVLADPEHNVLSRRHCMLSVSDDGWLVTDLSGNGTFLNSEREAIGLDKSRRLRDGDRLRVGAYQFQARIVQAQAAAAPASDPDDWPAFVQDRAPAAAPEWGAEPPPPRASANPFADDSWAAVADPPAYLSAPPPPSAPATQAVPPVPGGNPFLDDSAPLPPAPAALRSSPPPPAPPSPAPAPTAPPSLPRGSNPFSEPQDAPPQAESRPPPPEAVAPAPTVPPSPIPAPTPEPAAAAPGPGDVHLLAAFLAGAGMEDVEPKDPEKAMRALGAAFRAMVIGLREVVRTRRQVRSGFRIEQTQWTENPLKASANDEDALLALFGGARRTTMPPAKAVTDVLREIALHEMATTAAMQSAIRSLLASLSPDTIRETAEQAGGLAVLPAMRKARAWDGYEALYAKTVERLDDDFDSVFGKAFARAYEKVVDGDA